MSIDDRIMSISLSTNILRITWAGLYFFIRLRGSLLGNEVIARVSLEDKSIKGMDGCSGCFGGDLIEI